MELRKIFIAILAFSFLACTGPEPVDVVSECYFINQSGVPISMVLYHKDIDTIKIGINETYPDNNVKAVQLSALYYYDSIRVIFNSERMVLYNQLNSSSRNPLHEKSYSETKINENYYSYKYTFDSIDYQNAMK